jgi:hypothetical protein
VDTIKCPNSRPKLNEAGHVVNFVIWACLDEDDTCLSKYKRFISLLIGCWSDMQARNHTKSKLDMF